MISRKKSQDARGGREEDFTMKAMKNMKGVIRGF
jgi:hypothetical protein